MRPNPSAPGREAEEAPGGDTPGPMASRETEIVRQAFDALGRDDIDAVLELASLGAAD
jgi:hypothetical protein